MSVFNNGIAFNGNRLNRIAHVYTGLAGICDKVFRQQLHAGNEYRQIQNNAKAFAHCIGGNIVIEAIVVAARNHYCLAAFKHNRKYNYCKGKIRARRSGASAGIDLNGLD